MLSMLLERGKAKRLALVAFIAKRIPQLFISDHHPQPKGSQQIGRGIEFPNSLRAPQPSPKTGALASSLNSLSFATIWSNSMGWH